MNLGEDLKINQYALDCEWVKQPQLFYDWSESYADAVFERDRIKEGLDIIKAKVGQEVRDNPAKFNLVKTTVDAVNEAINLDKRVKDKTFELHESNRNVNVMSAAKEAMVHKKKALEMLVELTIYGLVGAEPKIKSEFKEEVEKKTKSKITDDLSKNKRLRGRTRDKD